MQRSRKRKLRREQAKWQRLQLASAMLAAAPVAFAQQPAETGAGTLEEVVVTAQKRAESLQDVPVSILAIGNQRLQELNVGNFADFAKFLPSVSFQTLGPGYSRVYMRGVAAGENGNHSGPLPSVGTYLDEQPITTIQGALDVNVYDIERVEALAGPQGTLYGASSQAGTIRIITNKPDPSGFEAGYDLAMNSVRGELGYVAEGFANIPVRENAAIRLVGWHRDEGGYIDNVFKSRTWPSSGATTNNAAAVRDRYNDLQTTGARAALKIDLNDRWTVMPTVMGQRAEANGQFGWDPKLGDLKVGHAFPEGSDDRWYQAALTVQGKVGNFDVVYAGSYLDRKVDTDSDYADYSFYYDQVAGYGSYFVVSDDGDLLPDSSQYIQGRDRYKKMSHEIRLTSPQDRRVRYVAGLFYQEQKHDIQQRYVIDGLDAVIYDYSVTGWPDTLWLTEQDRIDRDYAAFGEVSFDLAPRLTATGGIRFFKAKNSLEGFFGFNANFSSRTGEARCPTPTVPYEEGPCKNLDEEIDEDGTTGKVNLTYKLTDDALVYATWSQGFRPGGINRRTQFAAYESDFLTNYEVGWKSSWAGDRLRFNGALFWLDWDDFQFSYLGSNGLTNIRNAGNAEIKGVEADVQWAATAGLTVTAGVTWLNAELTEFFCKQTDPTTGVPLPPATCPAYAAAPDGTRLPVTPEFKGNVTARYEFPLAGGDGYVQAAVIHQTDVVPALVPAENVALGTQPSYTLTDLAVGVRMGSWSAELFVDNAFDERAEYYRFAQCSTLKVDTGETLCGQNPYVVGAQPRTWGIRFGQRF